MLHVLNANADTNADKGNTNAACVNDTNAACV